MSSDSGGCDGQALLFSSCWINRPFDHRYDSLNISELFLDIGPATVQLEVIGA